MKVKLLRVALPILCLGLVQCTSNTTSDGSPTAFTTLRLVAASGVGDSTFGPGKTIVVSPTDLALNNFALAVAIQPDNKIVVSGSNGLAGQGQVALIRYKDDGSVDTAFGTGGIVKTSLASPALASAVAINQPTDNKIVVAALIFTPATSATSMAVLRYNPDGTLDTGFGSSSSGVTAVTPIGPGLAGDTCAMLLQNGKIVVVGAAQDGKLVLARYDSAGVLDPTFGTPSTGTTVTTLGATSSNPKHRSPAMTAQSDGRIIVVTRNNDDQAMLRYSADGALDTTFGSGGTGIVITHITGGANYANAVAVQQPGMGVPANLDKIVVAGNAGVTDSTSDISLVRYSKDGALDTSFNSTGIVTTDIFGQFDNGLAVLLQDQPGDEPKILVSGSTGFGSSTQIVVLRYNKDGTADSGFGSRGIGQVFVPVVGPSTIASGNALAIQQGLGIIVTGYD